MAVLNTPTHIRVHEAVVYADLDGEAVLLNVDTGIYFGLNDLGTEIWKLLEQGASYEGILARLQDTYDVEPGQLQADLTRFFDILHEHGLARLVHE